MAYASINPYNGEVLKTFPVASDTEVEQILTNAHQAFLAWKDRSVSERCVILQHAADLLRVDANRYASLLTLEMGKITSEALAEVEISARIFEYYVQNAESLLADEQLPLILMKGKQHWFMSPWVLYWLLSLGTFLIIKLHAFWRRN